MSLTYITKEKYNKYVDIIDELEMLNELKETLKKKFEEIFDFDPEKKTYSKEKYEKDKESMLRKTNGERAFSESHLKASNKYKERNKEELNRKERERYHRKKQEKLLQKESGHIQLTTFV